MPRGANDNWDFLGQVTTRFQLTLSGRTYILGSDAGPIYLSRLRDDGVEGLGCTAISLIRGPHLAGAT